MIEKLNFYPVKWILENRCLEKFKFLRIEPRLKHLVVVIGVDSKLEDRYQKIS